MLRLYALLFGFALTLPPVLSSATPSPIPAAARPNATITERDMAGLITRLRQQNALQPATAITIAQTALPMTRLRALTVLVKLFVSPDDMEQYKETPTERLTPDAAQIPAWGVPYVAAARAQNWWPSDAPLRPRDTATWAFVGTILSRLPLEHGDPAEAHSGATAPSDVAVAFTGLVVDARDFKVVRAMGPRILDQDGHVLYPDRDHIPDMDYLQDHGMASYDQDPEHAGRAGSHPLIVKAVDVPAPGRDDVVVSNESAEQIREAIRHSHFLQHWSVSILVHDK